MLSLSPGTPGFHAGWQRKRVKLAISKSCLSLGKVSTGWISRGGMILSLYFLDFLKSYFPFVVNCISHDLKGHFSDLAGCLGLVGQSKDSMEIERVGGGGIMQQSG